MDDRSALQETKLLLKCLVFITLVNWVANFWNISQFGLYVDDYSRIAQVMDTAQSGISERLSLIFSADPRVRPLHNYMIFLLALLGNLIGGLSGIYFIGFLISTTNAILFFLLLRHIFNHTLFVVTGTLAFCLFPIATTKIWLTSLLGIQPACTMLLIAMLCYLSGKKKLSYLISTISLFCYETFFPVFFVTPFLTRKPRRVLISEFIRHALLCGSIFIIFFSSKMLFSDPRLDHLDLTVALHRSLINLFFGPLFNLEKSLLIPIKNLLYLPHILIYFQVGAFLILWLIFEKIRGASQAQHFGVDRTHRPWWYFVKWNKENAILKKPLLSALLMLALGYLLTINGKVHYNVGIVSRIHSAAVVGTAVMIAVIGFGLFRLFSSFNKAYIGTGLIAILFSSMITYNYRIQQEFLLSREIQRHFWSELIQLCPDVDDSTLILVDSSEYAKALGDDTLAWSVSRILDKIYQFPKTWNYSPRVYLISKNANLSTLPGAHIKTAQTVAELAKWGVITYLEPQDSERPFELSNTIVLSSENGSLHRHTSLKIDHEISFLLKQPPNSNVANRDILRGALYRELVEPRPDHPTIVSKIHRIPPLFHGIGIALVQ